MRCYICDFDEKLGNSDYVDFTTPVDVHGGSPGIKQGNSKYAAYYGGGGMVREDKDGRYICTRCRQVSQQSLNELEFLDIVDEIGYDIPQIEHETLEETKDTPETTVS